MWLDQKFRRQAGFLANCRYFPSLGLYSSRTKIHSAHQRVTQRIGRVMRLEARLYINCMLILTRGPMETRSLRKC
jgi:hypothetical protein